MQSLSVQWLDHGRFWPLLFLCAWIQPLFPAAVLAHGASARVSANGHPIVIEASYSGNEPMSYAEVRVFSPLDDRLEYQNGRTDKNGRFAFCPDAGGAWRVEISDGMGHRAQTVAQADLPGSLGEEATAKPVQIARNEPSAPGFKALETAMGLSLIMNFFLVWHAWKRRRGAPRPPPGQASREKRMQ